MKLKIYLNVAAEIYLFKKIHLKGPQVGKTKNIDILENDI